MPPLNEWQTFAEVVGSAAGALTGLQFVVMALISDMPMKPGENATSEAFAGPTIVHFVAVLLLAASFAMPWHSLAPAEAAWLLGGLAGLVYTFVVLARMRRQGSYEPVLEDWLFHAILPFCAYAALVPSALRVRTHPYGALFGIAAVALLLLVVGIHNAWDNVTFLVSLKRERLHEMQAPGKSPTV